MESVFDVLTKLTPYDVNKNKIRIGRNGDGGYILIDQLSPRQHVFSFGIGAEITFDLEMAERGHKVFMFDPTIEGLPSEHRNFAFVREGLSATTDPAARMYTLADQLVRLAINGTGHILKIDIAGHEWDSLAGLKQETLRPFDQIVVEVHDLKRLEDPAFRARAGRAFDTLNAEFTLFHVHGNNARPVFLVDGFPVCTIIELCYVRTVRVERRRSTTLYPTPLDCMNAPRTTQTKLWFYPFLPTDVEPSAFAAAAVRTAAEHRHWQHILEEKRQRKQARKRAPNTPKRRPPRRPKNLFDRSKAALTSTWARVRRG